MNREKAIIAELIGLAALTACGSADPTVAKQEIAGRYSGTGYGDPVPTSFPIHLELKDDHTFVGNLLGGPGSYPFETGHWQFRSSMKGCAQVRFIVSGVERPTACLTRLPDQICLNWATSPASSADCAMRKPMQP